MPLDFYFNYATTKLFDNDHIYSTQKTQLSDGTPAYQIDVIKNNAKATMWVFSNALESYYLVYEATPDKFDTYLPIAQDMFKSLSFTKLPN